MITVPSLAEFSRRIFYLFKSKSVTFSTYQGAIRGYDPVAYFADGRAIKGAAKLAHDYQEAIWYFSSEKNRIKFQNEPEKYVPQFGGYCAFGMSQGYQASTQPDAWTLLDNKLYLNYSKEIRTVWNKNQIEHIERANKNWLKLKTS